MRPIRTLALTVAACGTLVGAARGQAVQMDRTVEVQGVGTLSNPVVAEPR